MPTRLLIGLAVGSGFEVATAVAVRADGVGLGMTPRVTAEGRLVVTAGDGNDTATVAGGAGLGSRVAGAATFDFGAGNSDTTVSDSRRV